MDENKIVDGDMVENIDENTTEGGKVEETAPLEKKPYRGMTSTKNGLFLRSIIGAIVIYYGYSIFTDMAPTDNPAPLYVIAGIFALAGLLVLADSVKRLVKKQYDEN